MGSITTRSYRRHLGLKFLEEIEQSSLSNYYFYVSKPTPWAVEASPDDAEDTRESEIYIWDNIISLKKVQSSDSVFVVKRFDWDSDGLTIYKPFDSSDKDLYDRPLEADVLLASELGSYRVGSFYVMNSDYDVYICMDNSRNSRSIIEPTGRSIIPISLSDGYAWKYICSISDSDKTKFLTSEYIPVRNLLADDGSYQWSVQQTSILGAIESYIVEEAGSGYVSTSGTVVAGTSNKVTLEATASAVDNAYLGLTIHLSTGETAKIINYIGLTKVATVNKEFTTTPNTDHTYSVLPTLIVEGDGIGATIRPVVNSGVITNIQIISRGAGYSHANVTVDDIAGSGAVIKPNISYVDGLAFDPLVLLGAKTVCVNVRIAFDELGFFSDNDYRIFGMVRNLMSSSNELANVSSAKGTTTLTITGKYGTLENDTILVLSNGTKVRVVSNTDTTIDVIQDSVTEYGEIVEGSAGTLDATTGATIIDIAYPVIQKYTGDILFVSTRKAIQRSEEQLEDFKLFFKF